MAAAIARPGVSSFLTGACKKENRGMTYGILAACSLLVVLAWAIYMGDNPLPWLCVIGGAAWWISTGFFCVSRDSKKGNTENIRRRAVRLAEIVSALALVSLFVATPGGKVWVIPERGETSLSRTFFSMSPFSLPTYYPVAFSHARSTAVHVVAKDEMPLRCIVSASGITLNRRDVPQLERFLLGIAATRDPDKYLDSEVVSSLATSSALILGQKTTEEIRGQGQFLIPYRIGTPMSDMLARNFLRWQDGMVTFRCALQKFQS